MNFPFPSLALTPPLLAGLLMWMGSQRALWRPLVPRPGFSSPGMMAALFASALFILTPALMAALSPLTGDPALNLVMASHAASLMLVPLCWGLWKLSGVPFPWGRCPLLRGLGVTCMAMLTFFPLVYLAAEINRNIAIWMQIATPHSILEYLKHPATGSGPFLMVALGVCTVVPAAEEILFRGLWQGALEKHLGAALAIWIPSLLFASWHPAETYLPMLVFGLCLGWLTRVSGSLLPGIFLHTMFNSLSVTDVALDRFGNLWPF